MTTAPTTADGNGSSGLLGVATEVVGQVFATLLEPGHRDLDSAGLTALLTQSQGLVNSLQAVQVLAMAQLAATDDDLLEDGTLEEVREPLGHIRDDAQDLVAPALGCSSSLAGDRVHRAVRACTHLPALVRLQGSGAVGEYPARILVEATRTLTAAQCAQVLRQVEPALGVIPPSRLRSTIAEAVAAAAPEQAVRELETTSEERSLRRSHDRSGGQTWTAVLPNGDGDIVWAAIDAVARTYQRQGTADTLDQARADALLALARESIDATLVLTLAVPCTVSASVRAPSRPTGAECLSTHTATIQTPTARARPLPGAAHSMMPVRVTGLAGAGPVSVTAGWLAGAGGRWATREAVVRCHAQTGALLGLPTRPGSSEADAPPTSTQHDPPAALAAFIRSRDGRCRFPGCSISATFCDLDHVRPWPLGPTQSDNLLCLCRRHHRVKQRPGWRARLRPDAVVEWTNPHGIVTTTEPVDHLGQHATDVSHAVVSDGGSRLDPGVARSTVGVGDHGGPGQSLPAASLLPPGRRAFGCHTSRVGRPSALEDALGELIRPQARRLRREWLVTERARVALGVPQSTVPQSSTVSTVSTDQLPPPPF